MEESTSRNTEPTPILNGDVEEVFRTYPESIRCRLLLLRQLIFDVASEIAEVGELEESLKWGEPSYLTTQSKSGSTIRLGWKPSRSREYLMLFNCRTNLVETFRRVYPRDLLYRGNRGIVFDLDHEVAVDPLRDCIGKALTYHLKK